MRRRALADPVVHGDGGRAAYLADVDDPVTVQDRDVDRLADISRQRLAGLPALVGQVALDGEGAGQPHDAETEAVLPTVGELLDQAAALQHRHQPRRGRLVHAKLERNLGDTGNPTLGKDLQHGDGAVDRLHEGSGPTPARRPAQRAGHASRLGDAAAAPS